MDKQALSDRMVAACPVLAMFLHVGLTEWGVQHLIVYCNGGEKITSGPAGKPILIFGGSIADMIGIMGGSCDVRAIDTTEGLFTLWGLPPTVALCLGVILPVLLLCFTAYRLLKETEGRTRQSWAIFMLACGTLFAGIVGFALWTIRHSPYMSLEENLLPLAIFVVPALAGLSAGIWLWRGRSPKQPA